ncbi:MAG: hypothetical protein JWO76_1671 [Nocardioides sp.]|nr:hypothetical protein [Nocardioides sp.]
MDQPSATPTRPEPAVVSLAVVLVLATVAYLVVWLTASPRDTTDGDAWFGAAYVVTGVVALVGWAGVAVAGLLGGTVPQAVSPALRLAAGAGELAVALTLALFVLSVAVSAGGGLAPLL